MKKVIMFLLIGILGVPSATFANNYDLETMGDSPEIPIKTPTLNCIYVNVDYETGDLYISPNYNIINLNILITSNGLTFLNTTTSLNAGQFYTDCLDYLDEGEYILTLSTADGIISQYRITVTED